MFTVDIGVIDQKTYNQYLADWKNEMNEAIKSHKEIQADLLSKTEVNTTKRFMAVT